MKRIVCLNLVKSRRMNSNDHSEYSGIINRKEPNPAPDPTVRNFNKSS